MLRSSFFLRTKLLPPRAVSDLLSRPRLTRKLADNLNAPITMVAADAGCGKTTLIADFVRGQRRPAVWYQLDHTDADPVVFFGYVAHGIKNIFPEFGETIFEYLAEAGEEFSRVPERVVDLLINEILQSIEQPFILVLDDYHHIGRDTIVHRLVDRLVQYSSDLVHLIITTRDLPPLAIAKRRSQSSALVIDRGELLFTDDEVRDLFRATLNVELKDEEISEYRNRTHGWITALQLIRQVAEQEIHATESGRSIDLSEILKQSEKDIFDYFAEEVFSREDEQTRKLLMSLSVLDSLPLELCSRLFPDLRCSAALPEMAQKNVFLTAAGDGDQSEEYRFHPLFRDFLLRRLRSEIGKSGLADERNRIAKDFVEAGRWEKALPFLIDAENYEEAARTIALHGGDWIAAGAFTTLGLFAQRIPAGQMEIHPRSLLHTAEVARLRGETEASSTLLHRAVVLLRADGDAAGEAEGLHSLASLARRRGKIADALRLLEQAEKLVASDSETFLKCANTRGLCLITEGKWNEAESQFRYALELAERQSNKHYIRLITHNLALPPGFRGDFGEALRWFNRIFRDDEHEKQLPQEAIGHLNVARLHLYRGELDETEKHLERSLELCQLFNMKFLRGEIFEAYGNYYRERGDAAHAEEFYERALKAYDEAEIDIATKELNEERAKFFLERGDTVRARGLLVNLAEAREKQSNEIGLHTARLGLAQVDLAEGRTGGLTERIGSLLDLFHAKNHYYDEALAAMLMAETFVSLGREKEAVPHALRVLDLSARFDYDYWLRRRIRRNPRVFALEEIAERMPVDLRDEIKNSADRPDPQLESPGNPAATPIDLTINVLGHVDMFRDVSRPLAADAWTTRRARDIFCFIATSKHRRVAKDILIETFWPDEDPAVIEKNFHPTISHIRKALNSQQPLKQNFILFRDGSYQLNPELTYLIDTEEFDCLIADAEAAKRDKDAMRLRASLEAAHALWRGEFMAGAYESWVDERRGFYNEQFGRVTAALAKLALSEKHPNAALKYAGEALTIDPFREDMHRLTMKALAAQGKPAAVKKHFDTVQNLLKNELGITPSAETRRLAAELSKSSA